MVEKQSYLLELAGYIVLNPVRADMVRSANQWQWSSYRATTGQVLKPSWLNTDWLLRPIKLLSHKALGFTLLINHAPYKQMQKELAKAGPLI